MNKYLEKLLKDALKDEYDRGFEAGYNACKIETDNDHVRRLDEMYHFGVAAGKAEAEAEIGEIDLNDVFDGNGEARTEVSHG